MVLELADDRQVHIDESNIFALEMQGLHPERMLYYCDFYAETFVDHFLVIINDAADIRYNDELTLLDMLTTDNSIKNVYLHVKDGERETVESYTFYRKDVDDAWFANAYEKHCVDEYGGLSIVIDKDWTQKQLEKYTARVKIL